MRRPNLLLLWTDEQRADTLSAYGNAQIEMPHLNALAAESTVFRRAYCCQPVCTPSRGSILTGRYPHAHQATHNNRPLPAEVPCLPELLRDRDAWATGYVGKWHLGDEIFPQHGFDEWVQVDDQYAPWYGEGRDRSLRCEYHHFLLAQGHKPDAGTMFSRDFVSRLPEAISKPKFQADRAIEFMQCHAGRPWILSVNTLEPHMPFSGPRNGQYDPDSIPLPANYDCPPDASNLLRARITHAIQQARGNCGFDLTRESEWRRCRANYWGLCSQVDTHFGRILDALRASGEYDNTIVVFTSDHGDQMGSHRLLAKSVQYEESVRIPLVIKWAGVANAHMVEAPVSQIDLVPTLLDALGQPVPRELAGQSLAGAAAGGPPPDRDVFIEWNSDPHGEDDVWARPDLAEALAPFGGPDAARAGMEASIRTVVAREGWKFSWSTLGEKELFDLRADPDERTNLAGHPDGRARVEAGIRRIRAWQDAQRDTVALP